MSSFAIVTEFDSPSLARSKFGASPAHEWKFLIDTEWANEVEAWAKHMLVPDPHGDPTLGGAYRITSLYFDTPQMDVYYRTRSYKRHKFRVRRYGKDALYFLERKSKLGDVVRKRRTPVPEEELVLLTKPLSVMSWPGHWFHRRLLLRRLLPACRVVYQRTAFIGSCPESPLRLTLDRHLWGILVNDWNPAPVEAGLPLLTGQVVLELKFRSALPRPFKELVENLGLNRSAVSKYRLCREAWEVSSPSQKVSFGDA